MALQQGVELLGAFRRGRGVVVFAGHLVRGEGACAELLDDVAQLVEIGAGGWGHGNSLGSWTPAAPQACGPV
ncbi:hypothetical protein Daci_0344 [Delftia acidovorans SPH-1]|uniref:Uncharacterized protein n=1 Tax=Delftia acidovorans (strain DSM 14801 / SPH-1) TaxID=398578 RepID=A9BR35_DELAS|nr:hypothetical protein Daci_0344 [Delftia acidovorans SPH-1]